MRFVWAVGGLALLLGFSRDEILGLIPKPRELPRFDGATGRPWVDDSFVAAGAMQEIARGALPRQIHAVSSWLGTDQWQGRAESAWFKANRRTIHVGVAGYPQHAGCKVWAEFRDAAGAIARVPCPLTDPREQWNIWEIKTPPGALAVRVRAEDHATDTCGWVAFSHPFRAWPVSVVAGYQSFQIFTTLALALTLLWGPGLVWCPRNAGAQTRLLFLLGLGPLALVAVGILVWLLGGLITPQVLGATTVTAWWGLLGFSAARRNLSAPWSDAEQRVLALTAVITLAVVGKSFYSTGPQGELFRGTVSRNFEMADRIDSRYSFYVVQAVSHHWSPVAPAAEKLFAPWTFFSRGPLAGLTVTPVVMATNGRPPTEVPEDRWMPYDTTGFAAYRITMIALAGGVVLALFFALQPLAGDRWAMIAAGLLALSPFGVHEMMFTWPKWAATAWLLASFALIHARRPFAGGLALAAGFLFHPLVLLWTPWLGLWALGRGERSTQAIAAAGAKFSVGAALIVLPWMTIGALAPHLASTPLPGQVGFLQYWKKADWQPANLESWRRTRWMNFANTFVPLHVCLSPDSYNHPKLSSAYETSGPLVRFSQVWWNTLPFGLGVWLWALSLAALATAMRTLLAATLLLVVGPALLITAYWGMDPLGLMRECGHPLFVAIIGIACVVAARERGWLRTVLQHRTVPWLQLPETWLMLWLTTLLNPAPPAVDFAQLDWIYFAISLVAFGFAAWLAARGRSFSESTTNPPTESTRNLWPGSATPATTLGSSAAVTTRFPPWFVLAAGVLILALRRPDQFLHPQLWAEDGIFFFQAHEMGLRAFFLELAGYSQLVPRIIAAISQLVDPLWAPHVFVASGIAVTLYVMSRALSPRCPLPFKPLAALAIPLIPDAAEVLLNANNVQWVLALGGVLLLISAEPMRPRQWLHDFAAAIVFGLTGPFSVVLAPFFIARAARRRTRANVALASVVIGCGALQAASILLHPQPMPANPTFDLAALAAFPGARIIGTALLGAWQPTSLAHGVGMTLTAILAAGIALLAARPGAMRGLRLTLALIFAALLASALYRTWHSMPAMTVPGSASRYLFPLQLLLLWLLLASMTDATKGLRAGCAFAAAWMIVVNVPRLRIAPVPDKQWAQYAAKLRAGEEVTIPINPEGWTFWFPARKP